MKFPQENQKCFTTIVVFFRTRQKGDSKREKPDPERTSSQIFADFRWFSARSVNQGIWESQICAENRRKPQISAGNRRKPQIFAETGFSHLLSPFWRAPSFATTVVNYYDHGIFSMIGFWGSLFLCFLWKIGNRLGCEDASLKGFLEQAPRRLGMHKHHLSACTATLRAPCNPIRSRRKRQLKLHLWQSFLLGALKGTELRWQREPRTPILAENRRFSQIQPFSWKLKHLEGAGNHRKLQIFTENRRFLQKTAGDRKLGSVTLGPSPLARPHSYGAWHWPRWQNWSPCSWEKLTEKLQPKIHHVFHSPKFYFHHPELLGPLSRNALQRTVHFVRRVFENTFNTEKQNFSRALRIHTRQDCGQPGGRKMEKFLDHPMCSKSTLPQISTEIELSKCRGAEGVRRVECNRGDFAITIANFRRRPEAGISIGEVFGELGRELPAKFGRRFSSLPRPGKPPEAPPTKNPSALEEGKRPPPPSSQPYQGQFRPCWGPKTALIWTFLW